MPEEQKIILKINDKEFKFDVFLEESQNIFDLKFLENKYVSTDINNDKIYTKMLQKVRFSFLVIPNNKSQCVENFKNIKDILKEIKPKYSVRESQYVSNIKNLTGFITIKFLGLPITSREATINLTAFQYQMDKDSGFLEINKNLNITGSTTKDQDDNLFIPIIFKIYIEGNVLLSFDEVKV